MTQTPRRTKLASWTIQGPILLRLLVYLVAYNAALLALLIVAWTAQSTASTLTGSLPMDAGTSVRSQLSSVVACMLLMLPVMVWDILRLTHRVAGPLLRYQGIMRDFVRTGKLRVAETRKTDLLKDFESQFNEFVEAIHAMCPETQAIEERASAGAADADPLQRNVARDRHTEAV